MPTVTNGFELMREAHISEIASTARLYRHAKTGAELLSLINRDENKSFGATFRTPPEDSTGVAHILEHSVLCGTRKYRVKDPFAELAKSSVNTFLNAMTYPDKTTYPAASANLKDFYNLVDVYLDSVFHPLLTRETFLRQGWHYELEAQQGEMIYKGVVFNEMKGGYASPDRVLADWSQRSLYPDTNYGVDSGGDPKHILDLTHEKLVAFYKRYYHPSNARLFFYGDDDPERRLEILDGVLSEFEPIEVRSAVPLQTRFASPRRITRTYAAAPGDEEGRKAKVTVNWMLDEVGEPERDLAVAILNHILLGTPASPLRKALVDSGIGEDIAGHGVDQDLRQPMFSVGLTGIEAARGGDVEALVLETLKGLAERGIDKETVEASLNTVEFRMREQNSGHFPRGLAMMLATMRSWLHGGDPFAALAFEKPLASLKQRLARGERVFEDMIARQFVENAHRTTVLLKPDPQQGERENAEERERLERERAAMSAGDIAKLVEQTAKLKEQAEAPDSPELLAAIPALKLADIERKAPGVPSAICEIAGAKVMTHALDTNGVTYLDIGLDIGMLPADLLPWVDLLGAAMLETGAGKRDFVTLTQDIGRLTGGIRHSIFSLADNVGAGAQCRLMFRGKATAERVGDLTDLLREILTAPRLNDRERIGQLVSELKSTLESRVVPGGSFFARTRLAAGMHAAGFADERMSGASALVFLRDLEKRLESDWSSVAATLERVRSTLVDRATLIVNATADAAGLKALEPQLAGLLGHLPKRSGERPRWDVAPGPSGEGLTIPAKVNYVVKGARLDDLGFPITGATIVVKSLIDINWLWHKVRVQGGAYGGGCVLDRRAGHFSFYSYRDPNLLETLDVYDETADFLASTEIDPGDLERCIIGTIGEIEPYRLPDAKGYAALQRYLVGDTDAVRQRLRDEVLSTTAKDVKRFADAARAIAEKGRIVVVGSAGAIEAANAERPGLLKVSKLL